MRLIPSGTPSRTNRYVMPAGRLRTFLLSAAGGAAVLVLLAGIFWKGSKTVATPGDLSSKHAPFEKRCASCHAPALTEARCEYCHDPFGASRYTNAGHVWFGTQDAAKIAKAAIATVGCETCHSDHRGRSFPMTRVDERQCALCHFPSMARHPEFDLVKAGAMTQEGIRFPHVRHLAEMKKAKLEECQFCHEPTRDRKGFEPVSFDRHCARCHLKGGKVGTTDPIPRAVVALPQDIGGWADKLAPNVTKLPRDKIVYDNLTHRDPWVLYNLWKIAREVDPEGLAKKRQERVRQIEELTFLLREPPTRGLSPAALKERASSLAAQVTQLRNDPSKESERRRLERDLERVRTQIELGPIPLQMTAPRRFGRTELENQLRDKKAELADFDIAVGEVSPVPLSDREIRLIAVKAMTTPCTKCHLYNGPLMAEVKAAQPVLAHARFNHLPHVQQVGVDCKTCHGKVVTSAKAEDVNLPPVASCRTCHRPGRSRDDCAECHYYHPRGDPWPPI